MCDRVLRDSDILGRGTAMPCPARVRGLGHGSAVSLRDSICIRINNIFMPALSALLRLARDRVAPQLGRELLPETIRETGQ